MAKRGRRPKAAEGTEAPAGMMMEPPAGVTAARRMEARVEGFAEDLGRLLGTARARAEGWIGQRQNIAKQLSDIRDTASELLSKLTGGGARTAAGAAARRGRRAKSRRATVGGAGGGQPRKRRKMSAAARAAISRAQKARWRKQKAEAKSGG